ncbi:MAG TPA: peptidylprolyl isomerase [Ignavibacteriaceae bacterium]|nr:peptidylprolyl isomerase [Ignavibacteriaceae bacterium]
MKIKLFAILFFCISVNYSQEVLDRVVAVVDNEVILQSELEFQTSIFAAQRQIDPQTTGLRDQILNSMIEEKLIYAQANIDSVIISEEEVNQRIDYQIELFKQQYGSVSKIEQIYGMSIDRIRRELRDDVRKSLMSQRLQEKNFGSLQSTRREVEEFFAIYRDSLGMIPEKVHIYHIYRNPKTSDLAKKEYFDKAQQILDSIKAGADFAELAKRYSEDPGSAAQGGDLGFVKRGVFYPEFEAAAFRLQQGELSDVVESPVGFHIIQMLERRGESINTRHILIKIKSDDAADLRTIEYLSDVRDSLVNGLAKFEDLAKRHSEDKDSAPFGGELGVYYLNQLDKNLLDAVGRLKAGEISFPRRIEYAAGSYGYHIVYLKSRIPEHKANLEDDFNEIKKLADDLKRQKEYEKWIAEIKEKIFWELKI